MKIDKETLIKHRFWLGLALAVPLTLLAIFVLLTIVSGGIAEAYNRRLAAVKGITDLPNAKNEKNVEAKRVEAALVEAQKNEVWAKLYESQKHRFRWPVEFERRFDFQNGEFAVEVKVMPRGTALPKND